MRKTSLARALFLFLLLFTLPFLTRFFWAFKLAPIPYFVPDEFIYPHAGRLYLHGLASGNLSVFQVNAEHPPLSKMITGTFIFLLGPLGFSDIGALRVQGCFFSALTCLMVYVICLKADRRVGLLSWMLLTFCPLSIKFSIASLDVTSLFFASLSIYMLLKANSNNLRRYMISGIFLGLAGLCKYSAYPIVLGAFILFQLGGRVSFRSAALRVSLIVGSCIPLLILGNPLFWPPQVIGFSGYRVFLEASSQYTVDPMGVVLTPLDWLESALRVSNTRQVMFFISMFAHGAAVHPFPIFQSSYLPWIFLFSLLQSARRRPKLRGLMLESLLWFSICFLFFWLLAKSQAETYYSVWLGPPLAIFSAISIIDVWRKPR